MLSRATSCSFRGAMSPNASETVPESTIADGSRDCAAETTDEMVHIVDGVLKDSGRAVDGDYVVVVSGTPVGVTGTTNSIFIHKVGQIRA